MIEPTLAACRHAARRGIDKVCCGTVSQESIRNDSIDQFLLLDVLEHIEDDDAFLSLLHKKTTEAGCCLITVPAFKCLWSSEDEEAGHFRRYRIRPLCALLESKGFEICYRSYFMGFLFLPILLIRVFLERIELLKKQKDRTTEEREAIYQSQFKTQSSIVTGVLGFFEGFEKRLMKKPDRVLFGSSIIVVARKIDQE